MRVLFVAIGTEQLNISLLAAILRRHGHEVGLAFSRSLFDDRDAVYMPRLADLFRDDDVLEQALRFRPDVICCSSLTVSHRFMLEVAKHVKDACGATVIFGGVHASAVPEIVLEDPVVDYVCVGEGDVALPLLLRELSKGSPHGPLPNIVFRGPDGTFVRGPQLPFVPNLDLLPGFEKDIWVDHFPIDASYLTMSSRGCPFRCTFCFNNFYADLGGPKGTSNKYVRQRSVDHFMEELLVAKRRYGVKYVQILDDIFTLDRAWLKAFAERYRKEIGAPFQCLTHAHFLDEERVTALKEAGCAWVQIGVQSGDEQYKRRHLKRHEKHTRIEHVLDLLHKAGIEARTDHIFGLPGETPESQEKARELYANIPALTRISTFWLTYLPGTEIMDQALAEGTLTPEAKAGIERGFTTFFYRDVNVLDPELRRLYIDYEALFRILPVLPSWARPRFQRKHLERLPAALVKMIGSTVHTLAALPKPDLQPIRTRYIYGMENHIRSRLGLPPRKFLRDKTPAPAPDPVWLERFSKMADELMGNLRAEPASQTRLPLIAAQ